MMYQPIQINHLTLSFAHKTCFEDFSTPIHPGSRIAIMGRNGSGKSTLLKILQGQKELAGGEVILPDNAIIGYVPQVIEEFGDHSGGERLNRSLTKALSLNPNILLLDEPTNHLDRRHRKSLMRMLSGYQGTLIMVTHDREILRHHVDILWHIDQRKIHIFSGHYDDYMQERRTKRHAIEQELSRLERQKKALHDDLMKEQERAAKSNAKGKKSIENRKWPTVVSHAKASRANETTGKKKAAIHQMCEELQERLEDLQLPEEIIPTFSLTAADIGQRCILSVAEGTVGYPEKEPLIKKIRLSLSSQERIAIEGDNGSGKTTMIKALCGDQQVVKTGQWDLPKLDEIGYLDQHYDNLDKEKTVFENIAELVPQWNEGNIRRHLNSFLFRKNEEVNAKVANLSGGEKARLSLAKIAAKTPKLLILDEITNNLDIETCEHIFQVLKKYPGAMIIISHDHDFLKKMELDHYYEIKASQLQSEICEKNDQD